MSSTAPVKTPPFHFARALEIDGGIILVSLAAIVIAFQTGQEVARWQNIVFPPLAFLLALLAMRMAWAEIKEMRPLDVRTTEHHMAAIVAAGVAAFFAFLALPVILLMPFVFLGGVF